MSTSWPGYAQAPGGWGWRLGLGSLSAGRNFETQHLARKSSLAQRFPRRPWRHSRRQWGAVKRRGPTFLGWSPPPWPYLSSCHSPCALCRAAGVIRSCPSLVDGERAQKSQWGLLWCLPQSSQAVWQTPKQPFKWTHDSFLWKQNRDSNCWGLVFIQSVPIFGRAWDCVRFLNNSPPTLWPSEACSSEFYQKEMGAVQGGLMPGEGSRSIRPYEDVPALPTATPPPSDTHHTTPPSPLEQPSTWMRRSKEMAKRFPFGLCLFPSCWLPSTFLTLAGSFQLLHTIRSEIFQIIYTWKLYLPALCALFVLWSMTWVAGSCWLFAILGSPIFHLWHQNHLTPLPLPSPLIIASQMSLLANSLFFSNYIVTTVGQFVWSLCPVYPILQTGSFL